MLTLTVAVFATTLPFFVLQIRQLQQDLGRTDAQQTARYAQNTVDRELRNIGIAVQPMDPSQGILRNQPKIVQAHAFSLTFNTDLIANDTADVEAVYYDPNVTNSLTVAMSANSQITLPFSTKPYPDYTYRKVDRSLSLAETVSYWASVDSTSGQTDEYIIWRRVNDGPIIVVARGIRIPAGQPLFKYSRVLPTGAIDSIPTASLPIYWDQASSIADSIRTVTLTVNGIFHGYNLQNKAKVFTRTVNSQTALANIGLSQRSSCGDTPLSPGGPVATVVTIGGVTRVQLVWTASGDENYGEKDVERYAIFRRVTGTTWVDPIDQKGRSGTPTYMWEDFDINSGVAYEYGVVAQDCSPANSAMRVSASITHP
ncbi:MAG: hypothetical protein ABIT38_05325 [Gemmatimonadaceae bacterium]